MRNLIILLLLALPMIGARDVNGSTDYLWFTPAASSTAPETQFAWFNSDTITVNQTIVSQGNNGTNGFRRIAAMGGVSGDPVRGQFQNDSGTSGTADTSTGYSQNTWHNARATFVNSTSRNVEIDNGSQGTDSTSITGYTPDRTAIGTLLRSSSTQAFNGSIFMAAIWTSDLSADEQHALDLGFDPKLVNPSNLVMLAPLIRTEDIDIVGGRQFTVVGSPTTDDNPRIFLAY
jgi:hypothetical protein